MGPEPAYVYIASFRSFEFRAHVLRPFVVVGLYCVKTLECNVHRLKILLKEVLIKTRHFSFRVMFTK